MANEGTRTVRVEPGGDAGRGYDVVIGPGAMGDAGSRLRSLRPSARAAFEAYDIAVPDELMVGLSRCLEAAGLRSTGAGAHVDEDEKALDTVEFFLGEMTRYAIERGDVLVALGGGILGDVAGLAAALYRRGVDWVNCPTTLLAMVDASVGGKTAVNVRTWNGKVWERRKNMAGVFHQPILVLADTDALKSLPEREFRGGLAECVKHGLLGADWGDPGLLDWTRGKLGAIRSLEAATLVELIARNVAVKAAVVATDEREAGTGPGGGRMALNLGHTFAHALEAVPELELNHGEAVGLGLVAAAACSERLGLAERGVRRDLEEVLGAEGIGLPIHAPALPESGRMMGLMLDDKKVTGGRLRLVLPTSPGRVAVVDDPPADAVAFALDSIRGA